MNRSLVLTFTTLVVSSGLALAQTTQPGAAYNNADFKVTSTQAVYQSDLDLVVMSMKVSGQAGRTVPKPSGSMANAPVLAYVFPTTLKPEDVGFSPTEGIVALALTSHPDMDDTPLWDENNDGNFDNDGLVWHPHWVILQEDKRVPGGLSVKAFRKDDKTVVLPKTAPGVPIYFDSPGYNVVTSGPTIRVAIPAYRIHNRTDFRFDAVTCYLQMYHPTHGDTASHHEAEDKPLLGVYAVYGVLSGKLSLPYTVTKK
ncbi:hypothetical protein BWI97_19890 [Siphonobacter sp. BAB-5405]|uniref:hypothetical protein n=1 Tax=Siphonobacter sp. BAB-5405 TaxID=1864825 RepID=UPI000C80C29D|nr:hypothetical protein [Siphonobacter sp. BAB-5405]PMD92361.1 hypothetical protein BWI97_19890 [Siphonobacter sp. BAB-5405]